MLGRAALRLAAWHETGDGFFVAAGGGGGGRWDDRAGDGGVGGEGLLFGNATARAHALACPPAPWVG